MNDFDKLIMSLLDFTYQGGKDNNLTKALRSSKFTLEDLTLTIFPLPADCLYVSNNYRTIKNQFPGIWPGNEPELIVTTQREGASNV